MTFRIKNSILLVLCFSVLICAKNFAQQSPGEVTIENSAKIDALIDQKKEYSKETSVLKGFKIQLFYGNEKGAYEIKDEFEALFPEISTKIIFSSPEWKVQAGNYKTRLQADRSLVEIKKEYPSAIIFATEIEAED